MQKKNNQAQTEQMIAHEFAQMRKGTIVLSACAAVVFFLWQQPMVEVVLGLLCGCGYTLYNFWTTCQSTMRALATGQEEMATRMAQQAYIKRYVCTAIFIAAVFLIPQVHVLAAVIPLVFPHLILWAKQIFAYHFTRKEVEK